MHTRTGARDYRESHNIACLPVQLSAHDVCNKSRLSSHTNTLSISKFCGGRAGASITHGENTITPTRATDIGPAAVAWSPLCRHTTKQEKHTHISSSPAQAGSLAPEGASAGRPDRRRQMLGREARTPVPHPARAVSWARTHALARHRSARRRAQISAKTSFAIAIVCSMSASVCASDMNPASYCDGAR